MSQSTKQREICFQKPNPSILEDGERFLAPTHPVSNTEVKRKVRMRGIRTPPTKGKKMDEHQVVAMIATILEFLKSGETPYANYIAIRYRDHLRIAQQQVLPG